MNRFLQIHTLTSYPATLLNRDDAGFAKRLPFGGAVRTRVSSQCLKKHWRDFKGEGALSGLDVPMSVRSRFTFDELVVKPLMKEGVRVELARAVTQALMDEVLGKSAKAKEADKKEAEERATSKKGKAEPAKETEAEPLQTGQITVLGWPEVEFLLGEARKICAKKPDLTEVGKVVSDALGRDGKENLKTLKHAAGLDAALFGRMVTSDILARGDAAIHVAHAFTVHGEASESDYFSAVDDLLALRDDEMGSGHIGSSELTSGLFYGYVVLDVPLLLSNLEGVKREDAAKANHDLAAQVAERLVKLVATVSPGAKLGSTAPHSYAHLVFVESGNAQPRTLANAFLRPVAECPDLLDNSYVALAAHVRDIDRMYGPSGMRRLAAMGPTKALPDALRVEKLESLADVATWAAGQVRSQ